MLVDGFDGVLETVLLGVEVAGVDAAGVVGCEELAEGLEAGFLELVVLEFLLGVGITSIVLPLPVSFEVVVSLLAASVLSEPIEDSPEVFSLEEPSVGKDTDLSEPVLTDEPLGVKPLDSTLFLWFITPKATPEAMATARTTEPAMTAILLFFMKSFMFIKNHSFL